MIDKSSKLPIYYQIEEWLKSEIENQNLEVDKIIPSEKELMRKFEVSRYTVRQAIGNLVNDGYLYRVAGKGTFVKDRNIYSRDNVYLSFTEEMENNGKNILNKVIKFREEYANENIANRLSINKDDPVIRIDRVRYVDEDPFSYEMLFVNKKLVTNLNESTAESSLTKFYIEKHGLSLSNVNEIIEAVHAKSNTANLLDIKTDTPLLLVRTKLFLDSGEQIHYSKNYFIGSKYKINRNMPLKG